MPWKAISWWALGIVVAFALLLYSSQPFHSCLQEAGKYYRGDASQEDLSGLIVLKTFKSCIGTYILEKNAVITAFATIAIAALTGTIWAVNKSQLAHAQRVDRAYVNGGWGRYEDGKLYANINNDGKTPATVHHMAMAILPLAGLPSTPPALSRTFVNYNLEPYKREFFSDHFFVEWDGLHEPERVLYGRFWYTDVFGEEHESGFLLHVRPRWPAVAGFPEYWRWT
jgi:hypothetical protein